MSSFNAGSIVGSLKMDYSEFSEATRESTSLAGNFAEELGHVLAEATGSPLLGELANGFGEITASVASGNVWEAAAAGLHLAGTAAAGYIEVLKGQAESMHQVGLAAEKAGVSVEWMSAMGQTAKASGAGVDDLVMAMKFLEDRQQKAIDGNKEAQDAFADVGISVADLKTRFADPEALFGGVMHGMEGMTSSAQLTAAAMGLMSRAGENLLPLFKQGESATAALTARIKDMGGVYSETDAKMALGIGQMEAILGSAITGMEAAASRPIFDALLQHSGQLEAGIKSLSSSFAQAFGSAAAAGVGHTSDLISDLSLALKLANEQLDKYYGTHAGATNAVAQAAEHDIAEHFKGFGPDNRAYQAVVDLDAGGFYKMMADSDPTLKPGFVPPKPTYRGEPSYGGGGSVNFAPGAVQVNIAGTKADLATSRIYEKAMKEAAEKAAKQHSKQAGGRLANVTSALK